MEKLRQLYSGKAKIVYETNNVDEVIIYFKDDATAFNAQKRGTIVNKGVMNAYMTSKIFGILEEHEIFTHFISKLDDREILVKKVEIIPVEVVVRNLIAGSLASRLKREEGSRLSMPVREFFLKNDELGDPLISDDFIIADGIASERELSYIKEQALRVNYVLSERFKKVGIILVDFKLEFGRFENTILLADEITPDGCRLWDEKTHKKLDKDRFRRDLGDVEEAYREVITRLFPEFPN